jgi:hypothetical protein
MKPWLGVIVLLAALGLSASASDDKGPFIQVIDGKVSIQAEAVPLSRLLRLFDMATGLKSKVPPELANRNLSVRFTGLSYDDAVEKIFEGVPLDYIVVKGEGITVTAASQRAPGAPGIPSANSPFNSAPINPASGEQADEQPFFTPGGPPVPGMVNGAQPFPPNANQPQPAMIQTPFGPIPNPRAQQQQNNAAPMAVPGSQPFGLTNPSGTPTGNPLGDGSVPTYNPNPNPMSPPVAPIGSPNGYPINPGMIPPGGVPPAPPGAPRRPGGQ